MFASSFVETCASLEYTSNVGFRCFCGSGARVRKNTRVFGIKCESAFADYPNR